MSIFTKIKKEFSVNWGTVFIGWESYSIQPQLLTFNEIKEFAFQRLESSECCASEEEIIIQLLCLDPNNLENEVIYNLLSSLAHISDTIMTLERRKWRVVNLEETLDHIPQNPINGLVMLTDFWASYDYPVDSPHIVQGKDNDISPTAYYEDSFFQKILFEHNKWLNQEKQEVRDIERGKLILQVDGTAIVNEHFKECDESS